MQYYLVMAKMVELKLFECRYNDFAVVPFMEYTKREYENRVLWINTLQVVITAFIYINNISTELVVFTIDVGLMFSEFS